MQRSKYTISAALIAALFLSTTQTWALTGSSTWSLESDSRLEEGDASLSSSFSTRGAYFTSPVVKKDYGHYLGTQIWLRGRRHYGLSNQQRLDFSISGNYDSYHSDEGVSHRPRAFVQELSYQHLISDSITFDVGVINDTFFMTDVLWETSFWRRPYYLNHSGLDDIHLGNLAGRLSWKGASGFSVSTLFLPGVMPRRLAVLDVKDGKVTSPSPWGAGLDNHTLVNGSRVELYHDVKMPQVGDLVGGELGYGMALEYAFGERSFLHFVYMNKVDSKPAFAFDAEETFLRVKATGPPRLRLVHEVKFLRHELYSVEAQKDFGPWDGRLSVSYDDLDYNLSGQSLYSGIIDDTLLLSAYLSRNFTQGRIYGTFLSSTRSGGAAKTSHFLGESFEDMVNFHYPMHSGWRLGGDYTKSFSTYEMSLGFNWLDADTQKKLSSGVGLEVQDWKFQLVRSFVETESLDWENDFWALNISRRF